jgi:predicted RNase H-like HicB family nuclease/DNA-binding transcriptional MerR regulator
MSAAGYNVRVVEKLTCLTHRQLVHWDKTGLIRPSVRQARGRGSRRVYSFEDLVELRVVARLREKGVSLQAVRKAVIYLRGHHAELARPLARLTFVTDGRSIFSLTESPKVIVDLTAQGQVVIAVSVGQLVGGLRAAVSDIAKPHTTSIRIGRERYEVVMTPDLEDGGFVAEVPACPGCVSQGETRREARTNVREALIGWLAAEDRPAARARA